MTHSDHETRVGAHSVFSVVLMPSLFSTQSNQERRIGQYVQSESFFADDGSLIGVEPMSGELVEIKALTGVQGKYAVHLYLGHSLSSALANGKEVRNFLIINCTSRHLAIIFCFCFLRVGGGEMDGRICLFILLKFCLVFFEISYVKHVSQLVLLFIFWQREPLIFTIVLIKELCIQNFRS